MDLMSCFFVSFLYGTCFLKSSEACGGFAAQAELVSSTTRRKTILVAASQGMGMACFSKGVCWSSNRIVKGFSHLR